MRREKLYHANRKEIRIFENSMNKGLLSTSTELEELVSFIRHRVKLYL